MEEQLIIDPELKLVNRLKELLTEINKDNPLRSSLTNVFLEHIDKIPFITSFNILKTKKGNSDQELNEALIRVLGPIFHDETRPCIKFTLTQTNITNPRLAMTIQIVSEITHLYSNVINHPESIIHPEAYSLMILLMLDDLMVACNNQALITKADVVLAEMHEGDLKNAS